MIVIMIIPVQSFAQTINEKSYKVSIKPSISTVSTVEDMYRTSLYGDYIAKKNSYGLDLNYKFSDKIDVGLYAMYSNLLHPYKTNGSIGFNFKKSNAFYYGINAEIHLMPLLFQVNNSRLDIYTILKIGMVSEYWHPYVVGIYESNEWLSKKSFEVGLGLGVSYMLTERLGVFLEYNIGNFYNDDFTRLRTGIKVNL